MRSALASAFVSVLSISLVGCQAAPSSTPTPTGVTGHLVLAPGTAPAATTGMLFVSWLTLDEKAALDTGKWTFQNFLDTLSRGNVVGPVDAAKDVSFTLHPPRGRVVLTATVDAGRLGLGALVGEGGATLTGLSAPFDVSEGAVAAPPISLATIPQREQRERCNGARLTLEHIEAPNVAGTVGNPTSRRVCVRVPSGYADHPERHYPVIYVLPGYGSTDIAVITSYGVESDDLIVVAVDTSTRTGSTYLVDSPTTGQWDGFFAKALIPFIDTHYRTLPRRSARAIAGHSTGGFNAVSYGLRHPELFGVVGASSPDGLDFEAWLGGHALQPWMRDLQRVEHALGGGGQFISYAADWSPTATGYDWPFDASGAIIDSVFNRWLANIPATWLRDPQRVAALKPLGGHIYLAVGAHDEFNLHPPTVAFSKQLTAVGIANELMISPGGHGDTKLHMAGIVKFATAKLDPAQ